MPPKLFGDSFGCTARTGPAVASTTTPAANYPRGRSRFGPTTMTDASPSNRGAITAWLRQHPTIPIAGLAGTLGVLGSYAVAGTTPGFIVAPIAGLLARIVPGAVITLVIVELGNLGQLVNLATAVILAVGLLAAGAFVAIRASRRVGIPFGAIGAAVVIDWGLATALTGMPLPSVGAGVGAGVAVGLGELHRLPRQIDSARVSGARRRLVAGLVGLTGMGVVGGLYHRGTVASTSPNDGGVDTSIPGATESDVRTIDALLATATEKSLAIDGIEPLVSEEFYEVDINAVDPQIDERGWELAFTGAIDRPITMGYEELTSKPADHRFVTLRCVGEALNGHKMDNALWSGRPLADLVDRVGPRSECECVMLRAADGYYEEFPLAALERGFLAYGMNGRVLPRAHGYPLRALIPGHWGEINVKWLTEIEFLDRAVDGYWEERGWHGTGPVNTVAKLHAVNHLADDRIRVGGHAYAGLRGIEQVEVSTTAGATWTPAVLSDPLPGDDVWRQWQYTYRPPDRVHDVVVRAVDANGRVQPREETSPFPRGATGWVTRTIDPAP